MAKASFVAARGFGTEVVILNGLCRDRLGLQYCASVVPLCRVLSHTPLPAVQAWAALATVTTSWQRTSLPVILESVCQIRRIALGQICAYNKRIGRIVEQFPRESLLCHHLQAPAPPMPCPSHACSTSGPASLCSCI